MSKKRSEKVDLNKAAELLGYEQVTWDGDNDCYSGHGSSDSFDRSKDDIGGSFIAWDEDELAVIIDRATC